MDKNSLKLNAYGRRIYVERVDQEWIAYYQTVEGKRWRATDLIIPSDLSRDEVVTYIADMLHELASKTSPNVEVLE